jgi:hypothetical protein
MECRSCHEHKLSNEFPKGKLSSGCHHSPSYCLRVSSCLISSHFFFFTFPSLYPSPPPFPLTFPLPLPLTLFFMQCVLRYANTEKCRECNSLIAQDTFLKLRTMLLSVAPEHLFDYKQQQQQEQQEQLNLAFNSNSNSDAHSAGMLFSLF